MLSKKLVEEEWIGPPKREGYRTQEEDESALRFAQNILSDGPQTGPEEELANLVIGLARESQWRRDLNRYKSQVDSLRQENANKHGQHVAALNESISEVRRRNRTLFDRLLAAECVLAHVLVSDQAAARQLVLDFFKKIDWPPAKMGLDPDRPWVTDAIVAIGKCLENH